MPEANIDELFAQTLQGDYDDEEPWEAVRVLRQLGTRQVFEAAVKWTHSTEPVVRARGLDVIAQLGKTAAHRSNRFPEEAYDVVIEVARREREVFPLASALMALGHLHDSRAIPLIAGLHSHPSERIRFAVTWALGQFPNDPLSVRTLLVLMEDTDAEVRDWSTFALGVLGDQDSPEIREALFRRRNDENEDAREEALAGLGKRGDLRILPDLINLLEQSSFSCRVAEAASSLLGFDLVQDNWSGQDYVTELRRQFFKADTDRR